MRILDKIFEQHNSLGFNLFALSGLATIYPFINTHILNDYTGCGFLLVYYKAAYMAINLTIIIIWIIESMTNFKIKNNFIVNNKYMKILRYLGVITNTLFFTYECIFWIYLII